RVTDNSDGMPKVAIDGGRIGVNANVLRWSMQAPVGRLVSAKTNADADEQVRLRHEMFQGGKCCEVPDRTRIALGNDAARGLRRDHCRVKQFHELRHFGARV